MIYACGFGLCPLLEVILYRLLSFGGHADCPLSGVERCPLLGGSKCTISIGRTIRGMEFVRCTEVVCLLESPLLEVSLYSTSPCGFIVNKSSIILMKNRGCEGSSWRNYVSC